MRIGIFGTGDVGQALARGFLATGHEVKLGSREANNEKGAAFVKQAGGKASHGTFADAAKFGDLAVVSTLGSAIASVLNQAGAENLKDKIVIDTTNPLDFSKGFPPRLMRPGGVSAGEQVQELLPGSKVVKAFNTTGNALMFRPQIAGGPPTMFICGNDAGAKRQVTNILADFGWETLDVGGIEQSGHLESMCLVWVLTAAPTNSWMQAFKMLRAK
jgi:predicted dinucleotide-binding enzyme